MGDCMSFVAMAKVIEVQGVSATEKLILLLLANYADESNRSFPSYETLARQANCSRRTVIRSIDKLADLGFISVHKRKKSNKDNHTNIYTINEFQDPSVKLSPPSDKHDTDPSVKLSPPSDTVSPNTITDTIIKEPITKKKRNTKENLADEFDEQLKPAVEQIIEHRKEIGKPIKTKRSIELLIKKLKHYAEHWRISNTEALEFWLGENWQSIDIDYKYPFREGGKAESKYEMDEGRKTSIIATHYEKMGIDPWEEWRNPRTGQMEKNGKIKQDLLDKFYQSTGGAHEQNTMRLVG